MSDFPWEATASIAAAAISAIGVGVMVLQSIGRRFDEANDKSERRAADTHHRINELGKEVRDVYTPRDVFHAEVKRLDEAHRRLDEKIDGMEDRINCPVKGGR